MQRRRFVGSALAVTAGFASKRAFGAAAQTAVASPVALSGPVELLYWSVVADEGVPILLGEVRNSGTEPIYSWAAGAVQVDLFDADGVLIDSISGDFLGTGMAPGESIPFLGVGQRRDQPVEWADEELRFDFRIMTAQPAAKYYRSLETSEFNVEVQDGTRITVTGLVTNTADVATGDSISIDVAEYDDAGRFVGQLGWSNPGKLSPGRSARFEQEFVASGFPGVIGQLTQQPATYRVFYWTDWDV